MLNNFLRVFVIAFVSLSCAGCFESEKLLITASDDVTPFPKKFWLTPIRRKEDGKTDQGLTIDRGLIKETNYVRLDKWRYIKSKGMNEPGGEIYFTDIPGHKDKYIMSWESESNNNYVIIAYKSTADYITALDYLTVMDSFDSDALYGIKQLSKRKRKEFIDILDHDIFMNSDEYKKILTANEIRFEQGMFDQIRIYSIDDLKKAAGLLIDNSNGRVIQKLKISKTPPDRSAPKSEQPNEAETNPRPRK
ncbi:hypothetical protein MnTg02_01690 [bacterium MnTg02]|nr:hypothetical protein MnTg02_01690 [bacterium MnTg02]